MNKSKYIRIYTIIALFIVLTIGVVFWRINAGTKHAATALPNMQLSNNGDKKPPVPDSAIIESGMPFDGIPSLDSPVFVPTAQAVDELGPEGSGLVVIRGHVVRFYPYQILSWHEVVNDEINQVPVAVTYCALCNVGVVYERGTKDKPISFGVSGKVHEFDSLLYDRATKSLWSQVTGEAISGPLTGVKLVVVESSVMTLKEFAAQYPNGQVLSKFTGYERNYDTLSYGDIAVRPNGDISIAQKGLVHPKTEVIGIEINGKFKAYPTELLEQEAIIDEFSDKTVRLAKSGGGVSAVDTATGSELKVVRTFWFMWQTWHPQTLVFKKM